MDSLANRHSYSHQY
ncbi:hypothetical protein MJM45_30570 [Salmonella enterica subsp. enterica serovar Kentucky]|nr:hypothetical protein [Salmonella enterica subsp. enterica serovar Kentucky]